MTAAIRAVLVVWAILGAEGGVAGVEAPPLQACDDAAVARLAELMNPVRLGAHSGRRHPDRTVSLAPDAPVGQTFRTGAWVESVVRIALWQAFWHESWGPDEVLTLTLWDSPARKVSHGRAWIPYSRRMWESAVPMPVLEARVEPGREYYFELTCELDPLRPAEVPREWVLGRAPGPGGQRPGFAGGDGRIEGIGTARDDYPYGTALIGGQPQPFDLWFEVHETRSAGRDAILRDAFGVLDPDCAALQSVCGAVARRDWSQAMQALISHFEARRDLMPEQCGVPLDPSCDTGLADLACEHRVVLDDGSSVDLGPEWNHYALWPERGGVGLTRSGLRKWIAQGYRATGHEKYARAFADMLWHVFRYCPSPLRGGVYRRGDTIPAALPAGLAGGSMWSALSIGARMGHGFYYYSAFMESPSLPPEIRAAFILNLGQMAEVLDYMEGGGNWETQIGETLFDFGLTYPEFRGARARISRGLDIAVRNALESIRPDGVLREPTTNYHMLVMNRFSSVMERVGRLGLELPEEMTGLVERMFDYIMYATLPDGTLPAWGDSASPSTPDLLERGATLFGRDDFRYVWAMSRRARRPGGVPAAGGASHTPPARTSVAFPNGGYYFMRTGWGPEDHYLALHCGPYGSHGHRDTLGLVAAAHGRTVLFDPGIGTYGTPEAVELKATISHNTVSVDRRDAGAGVADAWAPGVGFDYFAGHNEGYRDLEGVSHHRRIWFLKAAAGLSPLWLILDDVVGVGDYDAQLWYRFAPADVHLDAARRRLWTAEDGGNLVLEVLGEPAPTATLGKGIGVWSGLREVPVACIATRGLPAWFATVAVPFRGQRPPEWQARLESPAEAEGRRILWVESGGEACLALAPRIGGGTDGPPASVMLPDGQRVMFSGEGLVLRLRKVKGAWLPVVAHGVRVSRLVVGSRAVVSAVEPQQVVDVTL